MKILLTAILLTSLMACGTTPDHPEHSPMPPVNVIIPEKIPVPAIDEKILSFMVDFQNEMVIRGIELNYSNVVVRVVSTLPEPFNGETFYDPIEGYHRVNVLSDYTRHIIYHELGHALFNLAHSEHSWNIMYPTSDTNDVMGDVTSRQLDDMAQQIKDTLSGKIANYDSSNIKE